MKLIVVDIDGTVSDFRWREQFVKNKELYYEMSPNDPPHRDMVRLVSLLSVFYKVVFCTGRSIKHEAMTVEWLYTYFGDVDWELIMRDENDKRPDHEAKISAFLDKHRLHEVFMVLEDRQSVVDAWRRYGVRCLQVNDYKR